MSKQIYAGNLSYGMTDEMLMQLFSQHGEVTSAKVIRDRESGRSKGFGFIEMTNEEEAEQAIQKLNGFEINGRNIRVNLARPKMAGRQSDMD
jgi:RNA recognition motif-containing protein